MNKDRCTGECCKAFVLNNYDREVLQQAYDDEIRILTEGMWDWIRPNIQDIINPSTKDEIDKISVETDIESDIIRLIIKIEQSILSLKASNHNVCLALSFLLERYEKKRNKKRR